MTAAKFLKVKYINLLFEVNLFKKIKYLFRRCNHSVNDPTTLKAVVSFSPSIHRIGSGINECSKCGKRYLPKYFDDLPWVTTDQKEFINNFITYKISKKEFKSFLEENFSWIEWYQ